MPDKNLDNSAKSQLHNEFKESTFPYIDQLYNLSLRLTGKKSKGFKLLKKTYSEASWFFKYIDKDADYRGWLFRIMRNAYNNSHKKIFIKLDNFNFDAIEQSYNTIKSSSIKFEDMKAEIHKKITNDKLSALLLLLPEELKTVIVLCDIQNFSHEEIADYVDVPVGVVQSRLYKARKMLFAELYKLIRN